MRKKKREMENLLKWEVAKKNHYIFEVIIIIVMIVIIIRTTIRVIIVIAIIITIINNKIKKIKGTTYTNKNQSPTVKSF